MRPPTYEDLLDLIDEGNKQIYQMIEKCMGMKAEIEALRKQVAEQHERIKELVQETIRLDGERIGAHNTGYAAGYAACRADVVAYARKRETETAPDDYDSFLEHDRAMAISDAYGDLADEVEQGEHVGAAAREVGPK